MHCFIAFVASCALAILYLFVSWVWALIATILISRSGRLVAKRAPQPIASLSEEHPISRQLFTPMFFLSGLIGAIVQLAFASNAGPELAAFVSSFSKSGSAYFWSIEKTLVELFLTPRFKIVKHQTDLLDSMSVISIIIVLIVFNTSLLLSSFHVSEIEYYVKSRWIFIRLLGSAGLLFLIPISVFAINVDVVMKSMEHDVYGYIEKHTNMVGTILFHSFGIIFLYVCLIILFVNFRRSKFPYWSFG